MMRRLDTNATAKSAELNQFLTHADVSHMIPSCIPRSAWTLFMKASPHVQREMVRTARQPDLIKMREHPVLDSEKNMRLGHSLCYCPELGRCPLAPSESLRKTFPHFNGPIHQYYPRDLGWWKMRQVTNNLADHVREHKLLPTALIVDRNYRSSLDEVQPTDSGVKRALLQNTPSGDTQKAG